MSTDSSDSSPRKTSRLQWLRPRQEWGVIGGALTGFLALLGPVYIIAPLAVDIIRQLPVSGNLRLSIMQSLLTLASFGVIVAAVAAYSKKLQDIGFNRPTFAHVIKALIGFGAYFVITVGLAMLARELTPIDYEQAQQLGYEGLSGIELIGAFIPLVLLTPLAEEAIFRGFMFTGFRRRLPFWAAALGVSILFGLVHGQWNVGLDVFALSLVSCYLVEKTGSLWPSIFLHMAKNAVAFWLLYLYNGG